MKIIKQPIFELLYYLLGKSENKETYIRNINALYWLIDSGLYI